MKDWRPHVKRVADLVARLLVDTVTIGVWLYLILGRQTIMTGTPTLRTFKRYMRLFNNM